MASKIGHEARSLFGKMHDKSSLTRAGHLERAERIGDFLQSRGLRSVEHCKTKHVQALFTHLQEQGLSAGTLANYASTMREIAERIGKENIVPRTNEGLGFTRTQTDRYQPMNADKQGIQAVQERLFDRAEWKGHAYQMQREFGLRLKESILSGKVVERDGKPFLQVDGAKGGRPRLVPIDTEAKAAALQARNDFVKSQGWKSLCPADKSLEQGWRSLSNSVHREGGTRDSGANSHANRHAYAQDLDKSGASKGEISEQLGHGREEVVNHYVK